MLLCFAEVFACCAVGNCFVCARIVFAAGRAFDGSKCESLEDGKGEMVGSLSAGQDKIQDPTKLKPKSWCFWGLHPLPRLAALFCPWAYAPRPGCG